MPIGIIGDSSCDLTPAQRREYGVVIAPLKIIVEGKEFIDNEDLVLEDMLAAMRASKNGASSACPSPEEFAALMRGYDECMVVTLSSKLSGSYNSAVVARDLVLEEYPHKKIHVFDSESASSGQIQVALMIRDLEKAGCSFEEITEKVTAYLASMHTLFVLEDLGNFIKNGRLNKVVGTVATVLSIRPIMSDDGHGEIIMLDKARGTQNALMRMVDHVARFTADKAEKTVRLVLTYCNCPERGEMVKNALLEKCPALSEVFMVPMFGLSSMYANEGGVIVAF